MSGSPGQREKTDSGRTLCRVFLKHRQLTLRCHAGTGQGLQRATLLSSNTFSTGMLLLRLLPFRFHSWTRGLGHMLPFLIRTLCQKQHSENCSSCHSHRHPGFKAFSPLNPSNILPLICLFSSQRQLKVYPDSVEVSLFCFVKDGAEEMPLKTPGRSLGWHRGIWGEGGGAVQSSHLPGEDNQQK